MKDPTKEMKSSRIRRLFINGEFEVFDYLESGMRKSWLVGRFFGVDMLGPDIITRYHYTMKIFIPMCIAKYGDKKYLIRHDGGKMFPNYAMVAERARPFRMKDGMAVALNPLNTEELSQYLEGESLKWD